MSAFYDQASLVVVPSGYKSGKIYAQKPLTTDGQLTFTRASTATRVNASGLIETVASGVPRLDYLNSSCPRLLLEPSSTTLLPFSEQLDNAAWDKTSGGAAITANSVTSPDGYTNADTITGTGAGVAFVLVRQTLAVAAAGTYTFSGFFKYNNHPFVSLNLSAYDGGGNANYNVQTGVVTNVSAGSTAKIENYGNGWYRCSLTSAIGASDLTGRPSIYVAYDGTTSDFPSTAAATGKAVHAWGFNMCLGSYVQSYLPTLSTSVTRVADAISKTLVNSNTNFSFFLELDEAPVANGIGDWLAISPSTVLGRAYMYANSFGFADLYSAAAPVANQTKFAWTQVSSTTAKVFSNGVLRSSSTNGNYTNPFNSFSITAAYLDKPVRIKQFIFFDAPITDAQAIEITTL